MKKLVFLAFTVIISSTFSNARADLQSQYNKGGCKSFYEHTSAVLYCVDGNNGVYAYDEVKRTKYPVGKVGSKVGNEIIKQFEIENGDLVEYTCRNHPPTGQCVGLKRYVYKRIRR